MFFLGNSLNSPPSLDPGSSPTPNAIALPVIAGRGPSPSIITPKPDGDLVEGVHALLDVGGADAAAVRPDEDLEVVIDDALAGTRIFMLESPVTPRAAQENAAMPVMARPRISAWTSWVPS
jgi:hypothetical protein